jgi:hypothetical protein
MPFGGKQKSITRHTCPDNNCSMVHTALVCRYYVSVAAKRNFAFQEAVFPATTMNALSSGRARLDPSYTEAGDLPSKCITTPFLWAHARVGTLGANAHSMQHLFDPIGFTLAIPRGDAHTGVVDLCDSQSVALGEEEWYEQETMVGKWLLFLDSKTGVDVDAFWHRVRAFTEAGYFGPTVCTLKLTNRGLSNTM